MVVVLSFVWFVDWTDWYFFKIGFCAKEFRIACSLRFADILFIGIWFSVFVKNTCLMGFGFDLWCAFSYLDSGFSSTKAVIMRLHWSRKAAKPLCAPLVNTVSDRLRFWELGCEHLYVLTVLRFSVFDRIFVVVVVFLRFCGWFFFFGFLRDPLTDSCFANWKFLFLKLQIFLFVLFRVLN